MIVQEHHEGPQIDSPITTFDQKNDGRIAGNDTVSVCLVRRVVGCKQGYFAVAFDQGPSESFYLEQGL
jgi:hypothetical protein